MIDEGVGGGGSGGGAAGRDDGRATLADGLLEFLAEPFLVANDLGDRLAIDLGEVEGGEHGGGVVAEDVDARRRRWSRDVGFLGELGGGAVLVEADHRGEAIVREAFGLGGSDHGVGVGGVSNDGDTAVIRGDAIDDLALFDEDFAVVLEEVGRVPCRGRGAWAPTRQHQLASLNPTAGSEVRIIC